MITNSIINRDFLTFLWWIATDSATHTIEALKNGKLKSDVKTIDALHLFKKTIKKLLF